MVDVRQAPPRKGRGYIRVSKKRRDMISPEIQRDAIDGAAQRNKIFQVDKPIEDLGLSGREFENRQIHKLVEAVQRREIEVVLLWKWSRFGRNTLESLLNIQKIYDAGGDVMAATEDFDGRTSVGRLQITQMLGWAQFQSDQIGENWSSAHKYRRDLGLPHSGFKTFGYKICFTCPPHEPGDRRFKCNECRSGIQKIDPITGPVLAECYRRYTFENEPISHIVEDLRVRGFRTEGGAIITTTQLYKWMDSGFGLGWVRWRSKEKILADKQIVAEGRKNYYRSSRPEYFDVWRVGAHKSVIEDEDEREMLWLMYLAKRFDSPKTPKRYHDPKYSVSGLLRCTGIRLGGEGEELVDKDGQEVVCRRSVGAAPRGKEREEAHPPLPNGDKNPHVVYFRCGHSANSKDCTGCGSIQLARVEREILAWVTEQAKNAEVVDFKIAQSQRVIKKDEDESERVAALLKDLDAQLSRLVNGYMKRIIPEDKYIEEKTRVEEDMAELRARSESGIKKVAAVRPSKARFLGLLEEWEHMTHARKRQALSTVISHVWVYKGAIRKLPRTVVVPLWASEEELNAPPPPNPNVLTA
ncbi:recombinase family protein [Streptomyces sp. RTd22]|uniref:recombinase family protein n=1 Tax=Streptomyces sp. RTd22 TaxID=1841249 RepID=UPI000B0400BC|nr:recombinase family protein [Streptomyces sp. RTd22]